MCRRSGSKMKTIFDDGDDVAPVDRQVQRAGQGGVGGGVLYDARCNAVSPHCAVSRRVDDVLQFV